MKKLLILLLLMVMLSLVYPAITRAYTPSGKVGDAEYTIYAPDFIWRGFRVNILFRLENKGSEPANVEVALELPKGLENHFDYKPENLKMTITLQPGELKRTAIANVKAKAGLPLQKYDLGVKISAKSGMKSDSTTVHYKLDTRPGSVVAPGIWSGILPPIITFAFAPFFWWYAGRGSEPGAWRTPSRPFKELSKAWGLGISEEEEKS
jgi:hypothetical protein